MKVTTERIEKSQILMEVEVDQEALDASLEAAYRRLSGRVNIPGFRKGKAPRHLIERQIGPELLREEAIDGLVPDAYNKAIDENKVEPVGDPQIEVTGDDPVVFKATIPVRPTVELGGYADVRVTPKKGRPKDKVVEETLEGLLDGHATWEPVDRPVKLGDLVTMTLEGNIGGETFPKEENVEYPVIAKSEAPVPGFAEMLEGTKPNAPHEFELTMPDDAERGELAGKTSKFSVLISAIKEKQLPDLNDEFAQSLGEGFETVEALRERVTESVEVDLKKQARAELEQEIIDKIVERAVVDIPEVLINREVDRLIQEQQQALSQDKLSLEDYLAAMKQTEEEHRRDLVPVAEERVKLSYVLSTLAEVEGLSPGVEETEAEIERNVATVADKQRPSLREFFEQPNIRGALENNLTTRNVMEFLVEMATEGAIKPAEERAELDAKLKAEEAKAADEEIGEEVAVGKS